MNICTRLQVLNHLLNLCIYVYSSLFQAVKYYIGHKHRYTAQKSNKSTKTKVFLRGGQGRLTTNSGPNKEIADRIL